MLVTNSGLADDEYMYENPVSNALFPNTKSTVAITRLSTIDDIIV